MNGSGFGLGSGLADGLASDVEDKNDMAIHTPSNKMWLTDARPFFLVAAIEAQTSFFH
jgi:hypothetical protein